MFPCNVASSRPTATRFAAVVAAVSFAAPLSSATIGFGPPPEAILAREKLSPIDVSSMAKSPPEKFPAQSS